MIECQLFQVDVKMSPVEINQGVESDSLGSGSAMSIIRQVAQELADMRCIQLLRVPLTVKPYELPYPVNVGFFSFIRIAAIAHVFAQRVNKTA